MNITVFSALLVLLLSVTSHARQGMSFIGFNDSRCTAAKNVAAKLAHDYISADLSCYRDEDCSEVNYAGGPVCRGRTVNRLGKAGYQLLLESAEYTRLKEIVAEEYRNGACSPIPMCARRPPGELKCVANLCQYKRFRGR